MGWRSSSGAIEGSRRSSILQAELSTLSQHAVYLLSANNLLLSGGLGNVVSRVGRKTVLQIARGPSGNQATRQLEGDTRELSALNAHCRRTSTIRGSPKTCRAAANRIFPRKILERCCWRTIHTSMQTRCAAFIQKG